MPFQRQVASPKNAAKPLGMRLTALSLCLEWDFNAVALLLPPLKLRNLGK